MVHLASNTTNQNSSNQSEGSGNVREEPHSGSA